MLQRIQTIYLLITVLLLISCFIFNIAFFTYSDDLIYDYNIFGLIDQYKIQKSFFPIYPLIILSAILSIYSLISFKNRIKQLNINKLNIIFIFAIIVFIIIDMNSFRKIIGFTTYSYGFAFFIPLLAIVFLILANIGINRDEKLVKSMDSLR